MILLPRCPKCWQLVVAHGVAPVEWVCVGKGCENSTSVKTGEDESKLTPVEPEWVKVEEL